MSAQVAIEKALRGNVPALRRFGVAVQVPRWRRRVQARLTPRRFQLWVQREVLFTTLNPGWPRFRLWGRNRA